MAYESTTLPTIRRELGSDLGLMKYGSITALTTTSATIPSLFLNTNRAQNQTGDEAILYRPDATTSADYKRYIATVATSTGAATVAGGANYADTTATSETGEVWLGNNDPIVDVLDCINRTLDYQPVKTFYAQSNVFPADLDYDCQESGTSDFTSVGSPTLSKVTTARRIRFGRRSLRCLCSGSDEGFLTATLPHVEGAQFKVYALVSVDVGGCSVQAYDITNSTTIGSAVATTEEAMMLVELPWQTPSTSTNADCVEIAVRFLGTTTTSDFYVNAIWVVQQDNLFIDFPSAISEKFKAPSIFQVVPTGSSQTSNVRPAHSVELKPLTPGEDFTFRFHHPDANPYGIQLTSKYGLDYPLFVEAEIPASDIGTFSAESDSTTAPANELIPRCELRYIDHVLIPRQGVNEKLTALRAIIQKRLDDATEARVMEPVAQQRKWWGGPTRGRV